MQATRAAGAMLISADSSDAALFWAAALVHSIVSLFWAAVLTWTLPRKYTFWWALVAAAGIAVLDLRVLGRLFPEVYALPFWPQFADHLAWGTTLGAALSWRFRTRARSRQELCGEGLPVREPHSDSTHGVRTRAPPRVPHRPIRR